jgi:hypothetical protein
MIGRWRDMDEGTMGRLLLMVTAAVVFGVALLGTPAACV